MSAALLTARVNKALVTMESVTFRGGARNIRSSTGSTPRLWAGGPSIIIFIHNICIAFSGEGKLNTVATLSIANAANDVLNWNDKKLRMLKKIPFPSATA